MWSCSQVEHSRGLTPSRREPHTSLLSFCPPEYYHGTTTIGEQSRVYFDIDWLLVLGDRTSRLSPRGIVRFCRSGPLRRAPLGAIEGLADSSADLIELRVYPYAATSRFSTRSAVQIPVVNPHEPMQVSVFVFIRLIVAISQIFLFALQKCTCEK